MRFETLSEYDEEIERIDEILDNFKEYINNYPQEMGVKPTYISMKYLREELKKEKDKLEENLYSEEDNSFFKCETDGRIKHIMKKYEFIDYIAVPFDITNKDVLKIFQSQNFISLKLKKDVVPDSLSKYWILKTTTQTFGIIYNDIIVFDKDWEIVNCLMNEQNKPYESLLACNDYIVERED